jgi:hypothetical protein
MRPLLVILLLSLSSLSRELETCYRIYFWFLPVAKSCVNYSIQGDTLRIKSWAKTIVIGRLVKRVNSWGEAVLVDLKPRSFLLFQREGTFIRDHTYLFEERGIRYRIVRYKGKEEKVKEGFFESSVYLFDPFSTSLLVYIDTPNFEGGTVNMFYDEKIQNVYYRTIGEEDITLSGVRYSTWKVLLIPEIETKGILKPKGKWLVWVDKETNVPVKLKIGFTIGSAVVVLDTMKGDRKLFLEVRDEQAGVF